MRAWRNRNASSPVKSGGSKRMSSLRTRLMSCDATSSRRLRRRELRDAADMEDLAFDGRAREHPAFIGLETVEPGGEQRLDRRRNRDLRLDVLAVGEHGEHLLEEERVSRRGGGDACASLGCKLRPGRDVRDELGRLFLGERLEQDRRRVELAAGPARPAVEELRAGEADDQDRCVAYPVGEVLDEVEQRRLGPVHVLEREDERELAGERLDELAHRPEHLLGDGSRRSRADRALEPRRDDVRIRVSVEQRSDTAIARSLTHDLPHRPVGDALAVREAAADEHPGITVHRATQLLDEACLADAGIAEDREELGAAFTPGALEGPEKLGELIVAADKRCIEAALERGSAPGPAREGARP